MRASHLCYYYSRVSSRRPFSSDQEEGRSEVTFFSRRCDTRCCRGGVIETACLRTSFSQGLHGFAEKLIERGFSPDARNLAGKCSMSWDCRASCSSDLRLGLQNHRNWGAHIQSVSSVKCFSSFAFLSCSSGGARKRSLARLFLLHDVFPTSVQARMIGRRGIAGQAVLGKKDSSMESNDWLPSHLVILPKYELGMATRNASCYCVLTL